MFDRYKLSLMSQRVCHNSVLFARAQKPPSERLLFIRTFG